MNGIAQLSIDKTIGRIFVTYMGEQIAEGALASKYHLMSKCKNGGFANLGVTGVEEVKAPKRTMTSQSIIDSVGNITPIVAKYSVEKRFNMVRDVTIACGRKEVNSAVFTGEGGLGKSATVLEGLTAAGLVDACKMEEEALDAHIAAKLAAMPPAEDPNAVMTEEEEAQLREGFSFKMPANGYVQIKGYSTARGLYETLYENNGRVIVFDDCDKVLTDSTAEMIFKGALDSNDDRRINWRAGRLKRGYPKSFRFTGSVIFITNMSIDDLDQALLTRANCIDLSLSAEEKIERMRTISEYTTFMPNVDKKIVRECLAYVEELAEQISELNMRTLIKAVQLYKSVPDWKDTFEFSACR